MKRGFERASRKDGRENRRDTVCERREKWIIGWEWVRSIVRRVEEVEHLWQLCASL